MVNWWVLPLNYLLGSLPCGVLVVRITKGVDIREYGSGSIGATNVSRVAGFLPALIAGVGDALKGFLGAYLATRFLSDPYLWFLALFFLIIGHDRSIFLRFKGGKGVATTLGILLFLSWESALLCFLTWVIMASITHYSSVGSLSGALLMPVFLYLWGNPLHFVLWGIFAAALVFWRHKENIKRLIQGKELRMGQKGA